MKTEHGYDSVVGVDVHFSGGEAQRLMIARALITDAPVLVLDEATAFADPDCEAAIQQGLSALARQRTLLVIAHRLHTITHADQILVLDGGRIVERGTHAQLTACDGRYRSMWERYQAPRLRGHLVDRPSGHGKVSSDAVGQVTSDPVGQVTPASSICGQEMPA
jgi:ATP-binding cassette subfamily B protein